MAIFMFVLIFYHRQALSLDEEEEEELPDVFNTPPKKPSILSEFVRQISGSGGRSSGRSGGRSSGRSGGRSSGRSGGSSSSSYSQMHHESRT